MAGRQQSLNQSAFNRYKMHINRCNAKIIKKTGPHTYSAQKYHTLINNINKKINIHLSIHVKCWFRSINQWQSDCNQGKSLNKKQRTKKILKEMKFTFCPYSSDDQQTSNFLLRSYLEGQMANSLKMIVSVKHLQGRIIMHSSRLVRPYFVKQRIVALYMGWAMRKCINKAKHFLYT